jgi:TRIAD3 protein (E3 ubiquitin-protein ligase RNF216)
MRSGDLTLIKNARRRTDIERRLATVGHNLPKELDAAKKKAQQIADKQRQEEEKERAERENFEQAKKEGSMREW